MKKIQHDITKINWRKNWNTILLAGFLILLFNGLPVILRGLLAFILAVGTLYAVLWFVHYVLYLIY